MAAPLLEWRCALVAFAPFTVDFGLDGDSSSNGEPPPPPPADLAGGRATNESNYGLSHLAAALLAVDHFNDRNASVVPELAALAGRCRVTLALDGNASVIDTGALVGRASQRFYDRSRLLPAGAPCAMVGPFFDLPAIEMGVLATAVRAPLVLSRAYNLRLGSDFLSRYATNLHPDLHASARATVSYLQSIGRTDFFAFLYGIDDTNLQRSEVLSQALDGAQPEPISFLPSAYYLGAGFQGLESRTVHSALRQIRDSGYRTIVVSLSIGWGIQEAADAAEALEMNNGDYVWCWLDEPPPINTNANVTKLMDGSVWVVPVTGAEIDEANDPFVAAWSSQGPDEVERLNAMNPIAPGNPGYRPAKEGFFQRVLPEYGSGSIYDAVMSVGFGTCAAAEDGQTVSGKKLVDSIRNSTFKGATGRVAFGTDMNDTNRLGNRLESTITWAALNIRDFCIQTLKEIGKRWDPLSFGMVQRQHHCYATHRNKNYIPYGLRIFGLSLMGISLAASLLASVWIHRNRKHRVLLASQPVFLHIIIFGTIVQATAIFTISFDEGAGWTTDQLDAACTATVWLLVLGFILIYGALWGKMSRVNRILQFRRRKVKTRTVFRPMIVFVALAVTVLVVWSAVDSLSWQRTVIDPITGESIGTCNCVNYAAFMTPLVILATIPAAMTAIMAWKTRDVDESYTESSWIFFLIVVQMEVMVVAAPVIVILRDLSTVGRYIGFLLMLWVFPVSTLCIIILPKYLHFRRVEKGVDESSRTKRGEHSGIRISGMPQLQQSSDVTGVVVGKDRTSRPPPSELTCVLGPLHEDYAAENHDEEKGGLSKSV